MKPVKGTSRPYPRCALCRGGDFLPCFLYSVSMDDAGFSVGLLIVTIGFCVIILLLLLLLRRGRGAASAEGPSGGLNGRRTETAVLDPEAVRPCPLCGAMLKRGERVKTTVYPGKPDSMAHIFGCPYCRPPSAEARRTCPVCRQEIADDGYVVARMFEGKGKKHVHVLGCTGCRRVR